MRSGLNKRKEKYDNSHRTHWQFYVGDFVLVKKDTYIKDYDKYDGPGKVI